MIEKMIEWVKNWFGKNSVKKVKNERKLPALLDDLEVYLFARYDFRFNVLTEPSSNVSVCPRRARRGDSFRQPRFSVACRRHIRLLSVEAMPAGWASY